MKHAFQLALESFEHIDIEKRFFAKKVLQDWPKIVGPFLSSKAQPTGYWQHILFLKVHDAIWKQEILLRKEKLLTELNSIYPDKNLFKEIRIYLS